MADEEEEYKSEYPKETTAFLPPSSSTKDIHSKVSHDDAPAPFNKHRLGIGYMLAMGVCGTVLVAIGSSLSKLAEQCGKEATDVATVFIARGCGAIFGAIMSAKLYLWFQGNHVMCASLALIVLFLFILPHNTSIIGLHIIFLFFGIGTAVTDTGCQIMTRKIHGKQAGPWLGANTVAFGIAGALVPLIELMTDNLVLQYGVLGFVVCGVVAYIYTGPNPEAQGRLPGVPPKKPGTNGPASAPHYYVEIVVAFMVFCFIGGKVTTTAYLIPYIEDTGVLPEGDGDSLILVLWVAITVGRLAGVYDQRFLTNKTLPIHLTLLCIGGFISMMLILMFPKSADALWVGVAFYGLFNGPCVGFSYDWNNRITYPTEVSMSVVMFGLNFGASLVPYITAFAWNHGGGPKTLIVMTFLSMFLPLPLLHLTPYLSYDPAVNPTLQYGYSGLSQDDSPI